MESRLFWSSDPDRSERPDSQHHGRPIKSAPAEDLDPEHLPTPDPNSPRTPDACLNMAWRCIEYAFATPDTEGDADHIADAGWLLDQVVDDPTAPDKTRLTALLALEYLPAFTERAAHQLLTAETISDVYYGIGDILFEVIDPSGDTTPQGRERGFLPEALVMALLARLGDERYFAYLSSTREEEGHANGGDEKQTDNVNHDCYLLHTDGKVYIQPKFRKCARRYSPAVKKVRVAPFIRACTFAGLSDTLRATDPRFLSGDFAQESDASIALATRLVVKETRDTTLTQDEDIFLSEVMWALAESMDEHKYDDYPDQEPHPELVAV